MVLQLGVLVFTLAITFIQSIYGLFSGVIMLFCTIVAAVVSLGCFDALNDVASTFVHTSYSAAGCLILLFVVTLLILRVAADNAIRGNVRVPNYVDWGGAGVLGFVTAQICMGILVMSFQMLPWGGRVMMYQMYERAGENAAKGPAEFPRNNLWLKPDGFTAGLVGMLSGGSLESTTHFASVYPDFPEWVALTGNTVQSESLTAPGRDEKGDGNKALKVVQAWEHKGALEARYRTKFPTKNDENGKYEQQNYNATNGKLLGVRLELGHLAVDRDGSSGTHRFRPTMIRLVGTSGDTPKQYVPVALAGADKRIGGKLRLVDKDNNFVVEEGDAKIDAYFDVDRDFTPVFAEYRRYARAAVTQLAKTAPTTALELAAKPGKDGAGGEGGRGSGADRQRGEGQMRFMDMIDGGKSGDLDGLPFAMAFDRLNAAQDVVIENGMFASGRVFGDVSAFQPQQGGRTVDKFKIPEGYRLLQIRYNPRKAHSLAGQVFNYVARTVNQYSAVDDKADKHLLSGYYAIVKRGGEQRFELFYSGEKDSMTFRGMLDFGEITGQELTADDDAVLGLLFIVPKNIRVTEIVNQLNQGIKELDFRMGG